MREKDQLIKHGSIMLAATYLSGIFNAGFHLVMVRMLGPIEYGVLFSLIGLFMMISLPANTIQTVISKYIAIFKTRQEFGKMSYLLVHSSEKLIKILGGLLVLYLLFSKKIAINQQLQSVMPVIMMGPIFCFGILLPIYYGAFQGLERFTELGLTYTIGAISRILFGALLVYMGFGVSGAIFGSLLSCLVMLGVCFWFLRDMLHVESHDKNIGKGDIYKYFIPVSIAYTCYGIATYIDVVIVKHYFSPLDAGHYSIVSMIGKNFLFPAMAFAGAMFPKISSQFAQGKETRHLLQKTLIYSGLISLAGIIVCVFFPNAIMHILMSKKDITEEAIATMIPLLRLIGFAITPYGLACIVINYYLAKHWTKFLPFLIVTSILQIALLIMFHNTLIQVLTILFVAGIFILLCGVPAKIIERVRGYKGLRMKKNLENIAKQAREASRKLALVPTEMKNKVLVRMADLLEEKASFIIENNDKDVKEAKKADLSVALIDRLTLNQKRIRLMADGLRVVAGLTDPVGRVIKSLKRPNKLLIDKVRVPIGVILIIYESRPNVTVDSAGLCFKSGNCVILRGGKESINSNKSLIDVLHIALEENRISKDCIQFIDNPDHKIVSDLLKMNRYIDLVIPRGGEKLIKVVVDESRIPVIKHYKGICHVYVDKDADIDMAEKIVVNAKVQRPGVCNAMETLLVHKDIAKVFLPKVSKSLQKYNVELRGCPLSRKIVPEMASAEEKDWSTEYLDLILSIKVVDGIDSAISHINKYGSMHSDSIVTKNKINAEKFVKEIDSACVFINASTRFSDGGEFGMGAEIGISTDKIHARGPMGLEELTSYKYIVRGNGQVRE